MSVVGRRLADESNAQIKCRIGGKQIVHVVTARMRNENDDEESDERGDNSRCGRTRHDGTVTLGVCAQRIGN